jgi:hypothetical protein
MDDDLAERIAGWRKHARRIGNLAFEVDDDDPRCASFAAVSAMYFAAALDAAYFGNQAPQDERDDGGHREPV